MENCKDVVLHWGGKFIWKPKTEYVGGTVETLPQKDIDLLCQWTLLEWYNLFDPSATWVDFFYKAADASIESGVFKITCDDDINKWVDFYKGKEKIELYGVSASVMLEAVSPDGGDQLSKGVASGVGAGNGNIDGGELVGPSECNKQRRSRSNNRVMAGRVEGKKLTPKRPKKRLFAKARENSETQTLDREFVSANPPADSATNKQKSWIDEYCIPDWLVDDFQIEVDDDVYNGWFEFSVGDKLDATGGVQLDVAVGETVPAENGEEYGEAAEQTEIGGCEGEQMVIGGSERVVKQMVIAGSEGEQRVIGGSERAAKERVIGGFERAAKQRVIAGSKGEQMVIGVSERDLDDEVEDLDLCEFDSETDFKRENFDFKVGQTFVNAIKFREALVEWNIKKGYQVEYVKNDAKRITAKCLRGCSWRIHASKVGYDYTFMIKTLKGEHTCERKFVNKHCSSTYLAVKYLDVFRDNPDCSLPGLRNLIKRDLMVDVTMHQVYKMKRKAKEALEGNDYIQYQKLWDYAETLRQTNPGTIVRIQNHVPEDNGPITFKRMYLGLEALKQGFLTGCRPVIGLDGCFLKTRCGGQLLSAIGRDDNDNMYPFAFCVVEIESYDSWKWFLDILQEQIGDGNDGAPWCFISDRQKGLVRAVKQVFPTAEHRFCVKHMYDNFQVKFKGLELQKLFWKAASVGNPMEFNMVLENIKAVDAGAYIWVEMLSPHLWSKSHFSTSSKCDVIVNNMNESFNAYIMEARYLHIIDMFEWIRRKLMGRIKAKKDSMEKHGGLICPRIMKKLDTQLVLSRSCVATMAGENEFEVLCEGSAVVVNLLNRECTCRLWDLTGIPCKHAVTCIQMKRGNLVDYVHKFYTKDMYLSTYSHMIHPMPSSEYWSETGMHEILPPTIKKKPGRPKTLRRKGPNEHINANATRASKRGQAAHCRKCLQTGHNMRSCSNAIHPESMLNQGGPQKPVNKSGRPRIRRGGASGGNLGRSRPHPTEAQSSHVAIDHSSQVPVLGGDNGMVYAHEDSQLHT